MASFISSFNKMIKDKMQKHHVHTTISDKHWELLKKQTEKFETQQNALEKALESLENNSNNTPALTPEEQLWNRIGKEINSACLIHKDLLKLMLETVEIQNMAQHLNRHNLLEYILEYHYQKPLKECSLKEIMEGLVINLRVANWFDSVNYTDDVSCFTLKITHSMNLKNSILNRLLFENLFRTYGAKAEIEVSERGIFLKVLKNSSN